VTTTKRMPSKPERGADHKFRWVRWATSPPSPLTSSERHVCHVLSMFADVDGTNCYPGEARIAEHVGVSTRSVRTALSGIRDKGAATRVHQGTGPGDSDVYDLTIAEWESPGLASSDVKTSEGADHRKNPTPTAEDSDSNCGSQLPPTKQDQPLPTIEAAAVEDHAEPRCEVHVGEAADHSVFCVARRIGA
jgi:hypothetical protein